jgi:hypothetical protein
MICTWEGWAIKANDDRMKYMLYSFNKCVELF